MKRFSMIFVLAILIAAPALAEQACRAQGDQELAAKPSPIDPTPRTEWRFGFEDFDADGFDSRAGGRWVLICPPGCPKVTTPPNHHGEVREFCDCDGDGRQDADCQIWIRTNADGEQNLFCTQVCPDREQCSMITVEKPDGTTYKFCNCI